jgi:hypothetical protein
MAARIVSGKQLEDEGSAKFVVMGEEQYYTFYLITYSNDFDYQFLTEEEYWKERESTGDRIVCRGIDSITVANAAAAAEWKAAYSRYIHAAWTPNQDREERIENGQIISEAQITMKRLEDEAKASI